MSGQVPMLHLYRNILREARRFPSRNRASILEEIKTEFRENRGITDPTVLRDKRWLAEKGLTQLRMYTGLDKRSDHWSVALEDDPFGLKHPARAKPPGGGQD
mmetsp:Transcript_15265/g.51776  ORF Transcript_15265/g.51776 Transcript_15265/m.51776 type:complete len:102 (+) Transcript_15265:107-412(+)